MTPERLVKLKADLAADQELWRKFHKPGEIVKPLRVNETFAELIAEIERLRDELRAAVNYKGTILDSRCVTVPADEYLGLKAEVEWLHGEVATMSKHCAEYQGAG